ncbi:hypothetical protein LR48_Vigan05g132200 [Vigna angularis]|uniref:Uncharacterized protein n=1 Tax=Phaseolus angularis TaxID=3914 RepID=A0A0L9UMC2_PHAAN|nr:hypothetical protein LR48_Vigan05g132200 [Vigna angularis]
MTGEGPSPTPAVHPPPTPVIHPPPTPVVHPPPTPAANILPPPVIITPTPSPVVITPTPPLVIITPITPPDPTSIPSSSSIPPSKTATPSADPDLAGDGDDVDPPLHDRPWIEPYGKGDARNAGESSYWLGEHIWNYLLAHWNSAEFCNKYATAQRNRASEKGGTLRTDGSITVHEHVVRMAQALGWAVHVDEVFAQTHVRKGTNQFVDERSQKTHEEFSMRLSQIRSEHGLECKTSKCQSPLHTFSCVVSSFSLHPLGAPCPEQVENLLFDLEIERTARRNNSRRRRQSRESRESSAISEEILDSSSGQRKEEMEDNRTGEGSGQGRRTLADYNTFSGPLHFNSIARPVVNAAN